MKLRIKDDAVRFRITIKELEQLRAEGLLEKETWVPGGKDGEPVVFVYVIAVGRELERSRFVMEPYVMRAELSEKDFELLASPEEEGVYIRREWTLPDGSARRFMFFVEKDRPGSSCAKPEEWVYEEVIGQQPATRRFPANPG